MAIQTITGIYHYSTQDGLNHFQVLKTQNFLRCLKFYNTHIYINTNDNHYCIERNYRQQKTVPCHLKTNSRLLNFRKYLDT